MLDISLKPEILGHVGSFPISNSFVASIIVSVILIIIFAVVSRNMKEVPGKFQLFVESLVAGLYNFVFGNMGRNRKVVDRFFPVFITLVLFFLFSNLLGMIPFLGAISFNGEPAYRAPTSDYGIVFTLTLTMFLLMQLVSIGSSGPLGYLKKFFNFSSPLNFVLGLLDIIGELAKVLSLSFRLFGNIFAGEVLAAVIFFLVPYLAPVPFSLLGLLGSIVQAFVFPILVLIFVTMNTNTGTGNSDNESVSDQPVKSVS